MSRRANTYLIALMLSGALAVPAFAGADSGGVGLGGGGGGGASGGGGLSRPPASGKVQPGDVTATVSGDGVTLTARISAILRHQLHFSGSIPPSGASRTVVVERLDRKLGWVTATTAVASSDGSFAANWRTNQVGRMATRVVVQSARTSSRSAASSPTLNVTVYRPAIATTYGEGFFGSQTACGQTLTRHMLGVAHRTLPCGTKVSIYWHGRTIIVPVIDRGPYANHADWDLTDATAHALGINGTETIGAVSLPSH